MADLRAARAKKQGGALAKLRAQKQRKPALAALRAREGQKKRAEAIARLEAVQARYDEAWDHERETWKRYDKLDQRKIKRDQDKLDGAREEWERASRKLDSVYVAYLNTIAATKKLIAG